jgi:uncharacterized cofD-like protein
MKEKQKKVVVIGGGTGTFMVLSGLKKYPLELSAVVSMADSGGSTGRLRDQLGVLPPGDVRQCLVALSESDETLRQLFNYRFEEGDLQGHSVGNVFISGLEKITGDFEEAVYKAGEILRIRGRVIPVTTTKTNLGAEYADKTVVRGESVIDEPEGSEHGSIKRIFLDPPAQITHNAALAILHADMVVIGPGDMYTSLGQCLIVRGVAEALRKTKARIVYNLNLMTKHGQTNRMNARRHVDILESWIGPKVIDFVLLNTRSLPRETVEVYSLSGERPIKDDLAGRHSYKVIRGDFLSEMKTPKSKADTLTRSLIRHDSEKIAATLYQLIAKK